MANIPFRSGGAAARIAVIPGDGIGKEVTPEAVKVLRAVGAAGKRALEFVEEKARASRVNALHLEVDRGNDPAMELYRRTGYENHGRHLLTKWLR